MTTCELWSSQNTFFFYNTLRISQKCQLLMIHIPGSIWIKLFQDTTVREWKSCAICFFFFFFQETFVACFLKRFWFLQNRLEFCHAFWTAQILQYFSAQWEEVKSILEKLDLKMAVFKEKQLHFRVKHMIFLKLIRNSEASSQVPTNTAGSTHMQESFIHFTLPCGLMQPWGTAVWWQYTLGLLKLLPVHKSKGSKLCGRGVYFSYK